MVESIPHEARHLGAALAIGLLIGLERGWQRRELPEGQRVAGLRTFALIGLLGGVLASLPERLGAWPLVAGLVGVALLVMVSYRQSASQLGDLSITSGVAMLLTMVLAARAAGGAVASSVAMAVIAAVLLNLKPMLHGWLRLIQHQELTAALQLLVLSVVILPYLPDERLGPYSALNPYELWWAVILIAGLSLLGHLAMRLTGAQRGIYWTGLLGGLASSTAATLSLSRYARQQAHVRGLAAAGIVAACGVMFLRLTVLLWAIQPALAVRLGLALGLTGGVMLLISVWQWRRSTGVGKAGGEDVEPMAPFDLSTALSFGAFLAAMAVLVPAVQAWIGTRGIYLLAGLSGLADVDAIVISLARTHVAEGLTSDSVTLAIGLAILTNTVTKVSLAWFNGGAQVGVAVLRGSLIAAVAYAAVAVAQSV